MNENRVEHQAFYAGPVFTISNPTTRVGEAGDGARSDVFDVRPPRSAEQNMRADQLDWVLLMPFQAPIVPLIDQAPDEEEGCSCTVSSYRNSGKFVSLEAIDLSVPAPRQTFG